MKIMSGTHEGKEIKLTGEKKLVFGAAECKDTTLVFKGERIVDRHFEIVFDQNTMLLINSNLNCPDSCGVYKRIFEDEMYCLRPGNAFRIGTLEFLVERYNTGIVSDIG
jgi:hypothetical protein